MKLLTTCTNKQRPCSPLSLTQVAPLSEEQKFAPHQIPAWQKLAQAQDREPVPKESLSQVSGLQLCSGDQDLSPRPGIPWPRSLLADSSPFGLRGLSWAVGVLALMDGVGTGNWQGGSWLGAPGLTDCIQQSVTALTENFSWHEKNRNLDSFQLYRFS